MSQHKCTKVEKPVKDADGPNPGDSETGFTCRACGETYYIPPCSCSIYNGG